MHTNSSIPYLVLSDNNVYHARLTIPKQLRSYSDKSNIKPSLKTRDKRIAKTRCFLTAGLIKNKLFELSNWVEMNKDNIDAGQIREIVNQEINALVDKIKAEFNTSTNQLILEVTKSVLPVSEKGHKNTTNTGSNEVGILISDLTDKYISEKLRAGIWAPRSRQENEYILKSLIIKMLGDISVSDIDYDKARKIKETLLKLPAHISKKSEYRGKSIDEIVNMEHEKCMSVTTVNKILGTYSSLMQYATRHGYVNSNPFEGLKIKKSVRAKDERLPFSKDDLNKIFSSEIFTQGNYKKNFHYWLPLLGLYTGARIGELCALYTSDIKQIDGIWVISINDENDKSVKTKSSIRDIPIADKLIELGFLDFVEHRKTLNQSERVFSELTKTRDGWGLGATKWFNRTFKHSVGITDQKKVFHSFRHLFSSDLVNNGVPREIVGALLGHHDASQTTGRYGDGYTVKNLKNNIEKLSYNYFEHIKSYGISHD